MQGRSFTDFDAALPAWLAAGPQHEGFTSLKPIQRAVLPLALAGRDVVGIAPKWSLHLGGADVGQKVHDVGDEAEGQHNKPHSLKTLTHQYCLGFRTLAGNWVG